LTPLSGLNGIGVNTAFSSKKKQGRNRKVSKMRVIIGIENRGKNTRTSILIGDDNLNFN
jgi:hypothetical protein